MITLFRRIREKLIASGSVTKYLLYAVGEILLVVVGILIALQVNNWNEERQFRVDAESQLRSLRETLVDEQDLLLSVRNMQSFRYHGLQKVLVFAGLDTLKRPPRSSQVIYEESFIWDKPLPENYSREFVNTVWSWSNRYLRFSADQNIRDDLERKGILTYLGNEELTQSIRTYYSQAEFRFREDERIEYMNRWDALLLSMGYISINPESIPDPLELLRDDRELAALMRVIINGAHWRWSGTEVMLPLNQALIDQIDKELGI
ncbi:hypothetical protein AB2B38_008215 [Balneola sp. MJW-20]|uniref:hypothetical protein n=1 Tax=Gracilimonas aurantiaca TaxID=3234185 RepID=UPI00346735C9